MKKTAISLFFAAGMLLCSASCGGKNDGRISFVSTDTAETYSVYSIEPEKGATYKAYAPDGSEIDMLNGSFALYGKGEYYYEKTQNGKISRYRVIAEDRTAPEIRLSYTRRYARQGEAIELPAVEVIESDGTKEASVSVFFGETEVTVSDGTITPSALGEYTVKVVAADKSGNTSAAQAAIFCTDNENKLDTVYEFSSAWGMENQTALRKGIRLELTDELAPNGEKAAKFNMTTPDYYAYAREVSYHHMYLLKPLHVNWAEHYSELYFWVNNQTSYEYHVRFLGAQYWVPPHSGWVKIEFSDFDLLGGVGSTYESMIDPEDCEGVYFCLQRGSSEFQFGTIYVSDIYGKPKTTGAENGGEKQQ